MMIKPLLVSAATAATVAAIMTPAPAAHAGEVRHVAKAVCKGLSPNLADNPYRARITTTQWLPKESGRITIYISSSPSLFGYQSTPRLAWRNLQTGKRGHRSTIAYSNREGEGATVNSVRTGVGRVRLTMFAQNRNQFLSVNSTRCTTIVRVR